MDFRGSSRKPLEEVFVRLDGLPTHASYLTLQAFIASIQADPTLLFPESSLVALVRTSSTHQAPHHATIRITRPVDLPEERWVPELVGACRRLKQAQLMIGTGPPDSSSPIEPVLLCAPIPAPTNSPSTAGQPLPLSTPVHFRPLVPKNPSYTKILHPKKRRRPLAPRPVPSPSGNIDQATRDLAELKRRESDFIAGKKLLHERSNRISPFQRLRNNSSRGSTST